MHWEEEVRTLLRRALAALEVGHPKHAATDATRAIGLDPGSPQGYRLLGSALLMLGRPDEALEAADGGLAHVADDPRLHRLRSGALFDLKRFDEALEAANAALSLAPEWAGAHSARAFALSALGRDEEAREAAAMAVSLEPEEADHHAKLSEEYLAVDPVLAERYARAALALAPEDVAALTLLGGALVRQGRGEEACAVWQDAVRLDPTAVTVKAALVHHLDAELHLGALRPLIRRTARQGLASVPADDAGLGRKLGALVQMLGLLGASKGLMGLASLTSPLREGRLKRRALALHALYLRLKEDERTPPE
jgi:tetratricopeptide (TPR) repeat protein